MALRNSKILKVAGFSFVGFCVVSLGVDRTSIGPAASQLAGFCGAFLGGWIANKRKRPVVAIRRAQPNQGAAMPVPLPACEEQNDAGNDSNNRDCGHDYSNQMATRPFLSARFVDGARTPRSLRDI